jgi:hypothetical protein
MTQVEWQTCSDLRVMLRWLREQGKASDRKQRLFAVACCRRVWSHIAERCGREAVLVSERYADGRASDENLETAFFAADRVFSSRDAVSGLAAAVRGLAAWRALDAARLAAHPETRGLGDGTAVAAAMAATSTSEDFWPQYACEEGHQCTLLRELFGNPLRPIQLDPAWLAWNDGTVRKLAEVAYDERDMPSGHLDRQRLAVVADALEQAGCADADVLGHLRSAGSHYRGCYALDAVLGKG